MSKINPTKTSMPIQPAAERVKNFNEVALGYTEEMAIMEAERCLECKNPKCVEGCPVEVDIPSFIKKIKAKEFLAAALDIKTKNNLPAVCGRVCPQENQCEKHCVLIKKGDPVGIGRLERFAADYELNLGVGEPEKIKSTDFRVAVIGAGPAGLTAAADLAKCGHQVTLFEALHVAGGVLMYGIPEFRLPKEIVQKEIAYIKKLGVKIEVNAVIGRINTVDELLDNEGFDAVFVGTGAGLPYFMDLPGENLNGVYSANEFLTRTNLMKAYMFPEYLTPIKVGKKVAVIGAGNVAMDAARTALRLGAEESYIIYRRSEMEMPARDEEIEHAKHEGVQINILTCPISYAGDENGRVKEMTCIRYQLGEPDASGRRSPIPIKDSEFTLEVDAVVVAIGQGPNPLLLKTTSGLNLTQRGNIKADEKGVTSRKGVFAGGDIVTGAATVIEAMGAGKIAARSINEYLISK